MNNRSKELLKNIVFFGISSFGPKLLGFFLIPLYTTCLTTNEYGISDLISTTVQLLLPILTLDINDAVLRYTIDDIKNCNPFKCGLKVTLYGTSLLIVIVGILTITGLINIAPVYIIFLLFIFFSNAIYLLLMNYLRAVNKIRILTQVSILMTCVTLVLNIVFLVGFQWGINGYLLATLLGSITANVYTAVKIDICTLIFPIGKTDIELSKKMIRYSWPLIFTGIAWWVNNASDKYFVGALCGLSATGIYSIAYKIPSILTIFQNIFHQAWQLSVFKEKESSNREEFYSNMLNLFKTLLIIISAILIMFTIPLAKVLYAKDFYEAWKYVPPLLIGNIFLAITGFLGAFFTALDKTKVMAQMTLAGAVVNIIFNIVLIPRIQVYGASIATMVGYFVMSCMGYKKIGELINLKITYTRDAISYILLILQYIFLLNNPENGFIQLVIVIGVLIVNINIVLQIGKMSKTLLTSIKDKIKKV